MTTKNTFTKRAGAKKDYHINWTDWLNSGDTVASAVWTVPDGVTKESQTESTTHTTIVLSGGTPDRQYGVTCAMTTAEGLVEVVTIYFSITQ